MLQIITLNENLAEKSQVTPWLKKALTYNNIKVALGFHISSTFCWIFILCSTNLSSGRIVEKIWPVRICLHKSELKQLFQTKS